MARRPLPFDPIDEARLRWSDRWDPEVSEAMAAATSIMRAQQIVLAAVDRALRPFGLTFARYEGLVLLLFSRRGALPLGIMGQRLMIHPASVTNIIDRLEAQGLVRRNPHPTDGRTTLAEITEAGRTLALEATTAVNAVTFGLGGLGRRDLEDLQRIIAKLRLGNGDFVE
jgi:DNA-binding MarR family transcriptional regulator